jgi:methionyl-tRNA formyltransferase
MKLLFLGNDRTRLSVECLEALLAACCGEITVGALAPGPWNRRVARGLRCHGLRGELMFLAQRWRTRRERSLRDLPAARFEFQDINAPETLARLRALAPDLIVAAAYMQILKPPVIALPPLGCLNVHPSLLPRYRGPAPLYWALKNREPATGVTIHYMDDGIDTGDIVVQESFPIGPGDDQWRLRAKLAATGARLLAKTVRRLAAGEALPRQAQDHAQATYFPMP